MIEVVPVKENRHSGHTITRLTAHIVWVTKYRYHVLTGDIKIRCRDLLVQICDAEDVRILKAVVSKDHVHMHIEYPPSKSLSDLVKRMKGRTSRRETVILESMEAQDVVLRASEKEVMR